MKIQLHKNGAAYDNPNNTWTICSLAAICFLGTDPPEITLSLTSEEPQGNKVKIKLLPNDQVVILESNIIHYYEGKHVTIFHALGELIKNNFDPPVCWLSITDTKLTYGYYYYSKTIRI
jgi:hypothetical protein